MTDSGPRDRRRELLEEHPAMMRLAFYLAGATVGYWIGRIQEAIWWRANT